MALFAIIIPAAAVLALLTFGWAVTVIVRARKAIDQDRFGDDTDAGGRQASKSGS